MSNALQPSQTPDELMERIPFFTRQVLAAVCFCRPAAKETWLRDLLSLDERQLLQGLGAIRLVTDHAAANSGTRIKVLTLGRDLMNLAAREFGSDPDRGYRDVWKLKAGRRLPFTAPTSGHAPGGPPADD